MGSGFLRTQCRLNSLPTKHRVCCTSVFSTNTGVRLMIPVSHYSITVRGLNLMGVVYTEVDMGALH